MNGSGLSKQEELLACFNRPCMLVYDEQLTFANDAAVDLLGRHIVGANVRLAIRTPDAIATILNDESGSVVVSSIGQPGSLWELQCEMLADDGRLVTMQDMSAQHSIAKVHTDFVANASHELRTPLANILGYVETLKDPKALADKKISGRFLGTIEREAARMQTLIEDLMNLSRIEAEKYQLPGTKACLNNICQQVADEFLESANIKCGTPKKKLHIRGDESQVAQMLRNLIDNAIKYGGDGTIEITLKGKKNGWANLTVTDEGEGIDPSHLPRLTERFYRTDPGRSKAAGGTGLGLSIVKHIVSRHRGRLNIESDIGQGSTFTVMLPLIDN